MPKISVARWAQATTGVVLYKTVGPLYYLDLPQPLPSYDDAGKLRHDALDNKLHWVIVRRRDRSDLLNQLGVREQGSRQ